MGQAKLKAKIKATTPKKGNMIAAHLIDAARNTITRIGVWPAHEPNPEEINKRIHGWIGGRYAMGSGAIIDEDGILCTVQAWELARGYMPEDVTPIRGAMRVVADALHHPQDFQVNAMASEAVISEWLCRGYPVQWCFDQPPILGDALFEIAEVWTKLEVKGLTKAQIDEAIAPLQYDPTEVFVSHEDRTTNIFVKEASMAAMFAIALKLPTA